MDDSPSIPPDLEILYEDNHLIAVFKEHGVLSQGDRTGDRTLNDMVKEWIAVKHGKKGGVFLGLLHRLDRPTAGIVLFAKTSKGAGRLSAQFRNREVEKTYWALIQGGMDPPTGTLEHFLRKFRSRRRVRLTTAEERESRHAELSYRTLAVFPGCSLLEINPRTGRKHQIRCQFSETGHPLLGDFKYRASRHWEKGAIALLAKKIRFRHPTKEMDVTIEAPLPELWKNRIVDIQVGK